VMEDITGIISTMKQNEYTALRRRPRVAGSFFVLI
jgi:hypothetical protein